MNISALNDARYSRWLALALFVITIISRIPFASQYLYHWDSVNMAIGMNHFDVLNGAPQFPGYIVYVVLAQVTNGLFHNEQTTLVLISVLSSGLAVVVMYYFGREMFNPVTGLIAAGFLATSPLFWFYSEIALPHTLDLLVVTLSAWMLYKIMMGNTRWIWWTAVLLALVAGFRQQDVLFLAPLAVFAGYRIGIVKIIQVLIIGALISVAWFVPLMAYSGGLQSYMAGSNAFTASFWTTTSIFMGAGTFGLRRNIIEKLIPYTLYAWSLALIPALYWFAEVPSRWRAWLKSRKVWFILLWIAPVIVFYAIIHMGQQGLVFVFMPALWLVSAEGLYRLFKTRPALLRAAALAIVLVNIGIFVIAPQNPLGPDRIKLLTFDTLRQSDTLWHDKITLIRENFKPENTLLVATTWRYIQYYLPEYHFAKFNTGAKFEIDEGEVKGVDYANKAMSAQDLGLTPDTDWKVVVFDDAIKEFANHPDTLQTAALPDGSTISYFTLKPTDNYLTDGATFGLQPAAQQG